MTTEDISRTGKCLVPYFQGCASIVCFTGLYSLSSLTTSTLGIYISSQITTLEKQFGFNSSQSGFILSCNDIGFLAFTLFISYRASTAHIPRCLAVSTTLFGLAGILCSCAFFLNPSYKFLLKATNETATKTEDNTSHLRLCNKDWKSATTDICDDDERPDVVGTATSFTPAAMAIIAIGMILQGVGKAPRSPFITYYIDENVDKRKTSLYLGVLMTIGIFGPALGFALGAVFSNIYVTLEDVNMSTKDPRWIGAWWLGFLLFGISAIVVAIPIFCFPNRYRNDEIDADKQNKDEVTFVGHIKGFVTTVFRLFKNGCFTFCILGSCCQMFFVAGMVSFMPKYLETQFTIPTWQANLLMGGMNIFSAAMGTFVGGYVVYKYRMTPFQCIKLTLILTTITSLVYILGFFVGCENPEIIGQNMESSTNITSCMSACNCDENYFPVCGSDNNNYFSYCHAGCTGHNDEGYTDCSCISEGAAAKPGLCKPECDMLYVYLAIMLVFALIQTVAIMPDYIFTMRCVDDKDKAMAVAFRSLFNSVLGWFPAPVIVGKVVDSCCVLWTSSCGGTGACALYDLVDFRYKRHGLDLGVKVLATMFYLLAFLFARKRLDLHRQPTVDMETAIPEVEMLMEKPKIFSDGLINDKSTVHENNHC